MSRLPLRLPLWGLFRLRLWLMRYRQRLRARTSNGFAPITSPDSRLGWKTFFAPISRCLVGISIAWLLFGSVVEWTFIGAAMLRAMDRATGFIEENTELIFRIGCVFFFVSIWAIGGIILTPELKADSTLDRRHTARHSGRHGIAPDHAVVGDRHLCVVRHRALEIRHLPSRRLSDLSRRRRLCRADRGAKQILRYRAPSTSCAGRRASP